jgi:hypothetical protein
MAGLEENIEREILSFETEEPQEYGSFEIDEIEGEAQEPEQFDSFEVDEQQSTSEVELDDQDVAKFMPAVYEVFMKQGEAGFDDASEALARDMTQYWGGWKFLKKAVKKAYKSPLGQIIAKQVKNRLPYAKTIGFALSALRDPSKVKITDLLKTAASAAISTYLPPGAESVVNSLGIIPGAGPEKNKPAMGNLINVVKGATDQMMNEIAESKDPLNPLEANRIVNKAFEDQLRQKAGPAIRPKRKASYVLSVPSDARTIRISFY